MRVALIEPVGGHGGMNYYDLGLARGLVKSGVFVNWYTCDETLEPSEEGIQVVKYFRRVYGKNNKLIRFARFFWGLIQSLVRAKSERSKIVHFHFFGLGALEFLMCAVAKLFGFRVCATVHDVESFAASDRDMFRTRVFALVDQFIVHNQISHRELSQAMKLAKKNVDIAVIPHGNYLSVVKRLDIDASREALNIDSDEFVFLFFGQIKAVKGLDLLLQAFAKLALGQSKVSLIVAGKVWKDDFARYQKIIDELNIADRVRLNIRYIPDEEVDLFYSAADCVVLPYRKIYQSGVLLMAMSYGLPVLASDLEGMTEVIKDGGNGFLFKSEDVNDLASKIEYVFENRDIRENVSIAALNTMKTFYDWDRIGVETKKIYEAMI